MYVTKLAILSTVLSDKTGDYILAVLDLAVPRIKIQCHAVLQSVM